ncbi:Uncharacterized protein Fot_07287 [Forsythia ovata]|uniref:Uncharacterized protein n=1 Tax=Forsythia ovata TaxID=205694 RepID=A0ABD1WYA2_9LAMI
MVDNTVTLNNSHQDHLASPYGQDALDMDQAWVFQVVKSTLAKDLGSGFEPHNLAKFDIVVCQILGKDASKISKHGPPIVSPRAHGSWQKFLGKLRVQQCPNRSHRKTRQSGSLRVHQRMAPST